MRRAFLLVLDSVGIGAAPDAEDYGDAGANTLAHVAEAVGGVRLPTLRQLALGTIPALLPDGLPIAGVAPARRPIASYGAMRELSVGKDTTTGHWEIAGLHLREGFHVFPPQSPSFPPDFVAAFEAQTGRKVIGNKAASGTQIIRELGPRQLEEGCWIAYTSADSVFQLAAHEEAIPLEELYRACAVARELLNPLAVGRVIARPFVGTPGNFTRTQNRRDFSYPLPEPTILDHLRAHGVTTMTVGKIDDVFAHQGIDESRHVENNADAQEALLEAATRQAPLFVFANFIDFDMLYGHRRDPAGYAQCLEQTDAYLETLLPQFTPDDVFLVTADHGNDPTYRGSDHTREYVPLICLRPGRPAQSLGIRQGFFDIAQSLASFFGAPPMPRGESFLR